MNRRLFCASVVFFAVCLLGCDDLLGGGDDWPGTYDLLTIDGQVLPVRYNGFEITSGFIRLNGDRTCFLQFGLHIIDDPPDKVYLDTLRTTFEKEGDDLTIAGTMEAKLSGRRIELWTNSREHVFLK